MRGSAHAHGTMNPKLSPDILDMVTKFYAVNKTTEILERLIGFKKWQMKQNWNFKQQHQNTNQLFFAIRNF